MKSDFDKLAEYKKLLLQAKRLSQVCGCCKQFLDEDAKVVERAMRSCVAAGKCSDDEVQTLRQRGII